MMDAPGMYDEPDYGLDFMDDERDFEEERANEALLAEERAEAEADEEFEPCCYNSFRNFGTGEHEYGCPNY